MGPSFIFDGQVPDDQEHPATAGPGKEKENRIGRFLALCLIICPLLQIWTGEIVGQQTSLIGGDFLFDCVRFASCIAKERARVLLLFLNVKVEQGEQGRLLLRRAGPSVGEKKGAAVSGPCKGTSQLLPSPRPTRPSAVIFTRRTGVQGPSVETTAIFLFSSSSYFRREGNVRLPARSVSVPLWLPSRPVSSASNRPSTCCVTYTTFSVFYY